MQSMIFEKRIRRKVKEINIVPILDMLTTIIFFLLLSTSFIEFNKVTVPPSKLSTISDPVAPPPLNSKISFIKKNNQLQVLMYWAGATPGVLSAVTESTNSEQDLFEKTKKLAQEFKKQFPKERTIQIGLGGDLEYQNLITVMDALREDLPDIVLYSYQEAEMAGTKLQGKSL